MLPRSITRLQNLQVLKLRSCKELTQLPKDIKKLVNLKQLDLRACNALTHMPRGIGQLTSLERLTRFVLPKSNNSKGKQEESESGGLGELHDLNKLGGKLSIKNLPHRSNGNGNQKGTTTTTSVAETCAATNLREKPCLQELELIWVDLDGEDDIDINEDEMSLEALQPHPNLKVLSVVCYEGMKLASWLSSLTNLVRLEFEQCKKCQSLPALDLLPSLKEIMIGGLTDLEYIDIDIWSCSMVRGGGSAISSRNSSIFSFFPSLEKLKLLDCPNLKGWQPSSLSSSSLTLLPQFQCLSWMWIDSCSNLTSMPPSPSLERLDMLSGSFKSLEQILKGTISPAHDMSSSSSLPSILSSSLKHMWISNIEHLPEDFLPVELVQTLTSLEDLMIWSCPT